MFDPPDAAATRARIPRFVVQGGVIVRADGRRVEIGIEPVFVGRSADCAVVIDDPEASALHCELVATDHGVRVRDVGSRNGTVVGGVRIEKAVLTCACAIEIGGTALRFEPSRRQVVDVAEQPSFGTLVGASTAMRRVFRVLADVAPTELAVLLRGETGTGKELVAQSLHEASPRRTGPFVVIDCAAIPATLAESTLFGHERGSFTGATDARNGAFQEADGGTIFLDELAELPADVQPKLLRALAEKKVKRVGGSAYKSVDVRVVAAGRRDFAEQMNAGQFRSDLYFRLAQVTVTLPPLRERRDDVPLLVAAVCARLGRTDRTDEVVRFVTDAFGAHDWPGNVRELVNVVSVAASLPPGSPVVAELLSLERASAATGGSLPSASSFADAKRVALEAFERRFFTELHAATGGNVSEMARRSGLSRQYVRGYLQKHQIERPSG